jgi:hypothetical protein
MFRRRQRDGDAVDKGVDSVNLAEYEFCEDRMIGSNTLKGRNMGLRGQNGSTFR